MTKPIGARDPIEFDKAKILAAVTRRMQDVAAMQPEVLKRYGIDTDSSMIAHALEHFGRGSEMTEYCLEAMSKAHKEQPLTILDVSNTIRVLIYALIHAHPGPEIAMVISTMGDEITLTGTMKAMHRSVNPEA